MIIDLWVNSLSKDAAAAFLGKSGFGSVEGFFGVDVREGMTPLDLVAEMDRVGVDRAVLSTSLSAVDDDTLAFVAEQHDRLYLAASVDRPERPRQQSMAVRPGRRGNRRPGPGVPAGRPVPPQPRPLLPDLRHLRGVGPPVSINVGIPGPRVRSRCQDPVLLEDVLIDFPELVVIGAHMGHPYEELLIEYMLKWPNLYLSNSAFLAKYMHPAADHVHGISPWPGSGAVRLGPSIPPHGEGPCTPPVPCPWATDRWPTSWAALPSASSRSGPMVDLLPDQLRLMASAYPDEVAYRNLGDGSSITFGRWEQESNRLAHGLQATGVGKGDLVAIYLEAQQILDFIVTYSAVHKIGAVSVPMNNRLSPPEVRSILEHAEVTAVVCSGAFEDAVAPLLGIPPVVGGRGHRGPVGARPVRRPRGREERGRRGHPGTARRGRPGRRHVHVGDHGRPKGVAVRHGNVALLPNALPRWNGSKWLRPLPSSPSPVSASSITR